MAKRKVDPNFERRSVCLGPSYIHKLDDYVILRGSSRREELIRLVGLGRSLPRDPEVREDRYLEDMGRDGTLTIKCPKWWWIRLREDANERDETLSATLRALLDAGLVHPDAGDSNPEGVLRRAKHYLASAPGAKPGALGNFLWPPARKGGRDDEGIYSTGESGRKRGWNGAYAAKTVLDRLAEGGKS